LSISIFTKKNNIFFQSHTPKPQRIASTILYAYFCRKNVPLCAIVHFIFILIIQKMAYILSEPVQHFLQKKAHYNFINGVFALDANAKSIVIENPADEQTLGTVQNTTHSELDRTIAAAQKGLLAWRKHTPAQRERFLQIFADTIEQNALAIAEILVLEQGKLLRDAKGEVAAAVSCFRYFAGWATKITGDTLDTSLTAPNTSFFAYTRREPIGVVAAIAPWNVPVMMFAWKIAPALACGCSIIFKPSEFTPLTALFIAEITQNIGLPEGVLNIVNGDGAQVGDYLVRNAGIAKISFTGSTHTGKLIARTAAERLARVTLELGGKNPVIVMPDADWNAARTGIARSALYNQGQVCVAGSRVYFPKKQFDTYAADLAQALSKTVVADGFAPDAGLGPVVAKAHFEKVLQCINTANTDGLTCLTGGEKAADKGYFIQPTLFANTDKKEVAMTREEVFGPVLVAMPFDDINEVLAAANNSPYGLSASVWTQHIGTAQYLIENLATGLIFVNSPVRSDNNLPLGGFKQSGIGRELGSAAIAQYTELKSVVVAF
jgi:phenylacetaldehyde dehydrogenase